MNVLVIGSGGREHALCWALAASPLLTKLYCVPGNAGIAEVAECLALDPLDSDGIVAACAAGRIDLVVVGPEAPLVAGLVDRLKQAGIAAFGPSAAAAALEGSKGFMKDFCARHNIPTAAYRRCRDAAEAKAFIGAEGAPIVVKADGLAAGKGVVVAESIDAAEQAVDELMAAYDGGLVVEAFLQGEEASFFALCDGRHAVPLGSAQDHKRAFDGDAGPNTGGMGAYSPAPALTPALQQQVMQQIIEPTLAGMAAEGRPFVGILYAGLMLTPAGPSLLEYNVRFGDPECQVLMKRLKSDLLPALLAATDGLLKAFDLRWSDEAALCVVMAARGYPGAYEKGSEILGLKQADASEGVTIFHAGTRRDGAKVLAAGGRVLGVTALGANVGEAQRRAYAAVDRIDWPGGFCRRDIGWRAVEREQSR